MLRTWVKIGRKYKKKAKYFPHLAVPFYSLSLSTSLRLESRSFLLNSKYLNRQAIEINASPAAIKK
jgi:hypothetical protein